MESSVQQLLEYHAQIEWRDRLGNTALHAAATHGRDHVVRALVTVGANVDGLSGGGDTPLHWASFSGHVETATTLLDLDARIHLRNSEGETAMDVARAGHRTDIVTVMTQLELLQARQRLALAFASMVELGGVEESGHPLPNDVLIIISISEMLLRPRMEVLRRDVPRFNY